MTNALTPILAYKADEVAALKAGCSGAELIDLIAEQSPARGFARALTSRVVAGDNGLICELKRKSPSAGEILPGADPVEIAKEYEDGGAACLSVLTDFPSFGGTLADLEAIRAGVSIPILRKDFMIDPIQVAQARASGADAILIIMAAVSDELARDLESTAIEQGMDALIEVHNEEELERALSLSSPLLGINNRNLTTMTTDLSVTTRLAPLIPETKYLVSESGVKTPEDITYLKASGARRFLIGESLMRQENRTDAVESLRKA
ncbi:MAG: indole-3-glycerol phosphate synthase TrpC [Hyphomonadaceae bacterium]